MVAHVDYYWPFGQADLLYLNFGTVVWSVTTGLALGLATGEWWKSCVARFWLAMNGQLPLRAIRFLDDARQRGLLRQSGGSYEFRHRVIRDYLAGSAVAVPEARTGA